MKFNKVNIRELIGLANFSLHKTVLPPLDELKQKLDDFYVDIEDYTTEDVGKPCYILQDNCGNFKIRGIYFGETFAPKDYFAVIEALNTLSDDLLFHDVVDYIFGSNYDKGILEDKEAEQYIRNKGSFLDLYRYITENLLDVGEAGTYLYALATNDTSLFEELTD